MKIIAESFNFHTFLVAAIQAASAGRDGTLHHEVAAGNHDTLAVRVFSVRFWSCPDPAKKSLVEVAY